MEWGSGKGPPGQGRQLFPCFGAQEAAWGWLCPESPQRGTVEAQEAEATSCEKGNSHQT